jgi:hypothetical protein
MDVGSLYQFALMLVLVAMVAGVGVLTLDKFSQTSGVTAAANTSIIAGRDAVGDIPEDWMSLIVTVGVLSIILGLVIAGFAYFRRR